MTVDAFAACSTRTHFLSLAWSKLRLCLANHRRGYWSNLPCDWPNTAWAYTEQETENRPRSSSATIWHFQMRPSSSMNDSVHLSVCLSVRLSAYLSVRHIFLTMLPSLYHHEIFRSYYQWQKWCLCKSSSSEVIGQGHWGHDPTYLIQSVKFLGHTAKKIVAFDPNLAFPDHNSSLNSPMVMKWCTKLEVA